MKGSQPGRCKAVAGGRGAESVRSSELTRVVPSMPHESDPDEIKQPEPKKPSAKLDPVEEEEAPAPAPKKPTGPAPPTPEYGELTTVWGLSELTDLGPAGPNTATSKASP